ncbi:hypothetical protein G7K_6362-t1 [Saitoella complicata NRRL Y-17804]|uniref:Uncharacterized protein n=1 Tax=Saitoella complicata (strain BCRC 22490 / CBS 7301 / JCM 7358 / NBRC 10748 / NRRL Y-17804) TaxID=698492 RepID=A0A0E9NQX8_SAICN|nr:hypothetical protein G7K_6362-t1 [Saitoella complicata NRRL Y-17804]
MSLRRISRKHLVSTTRLGDDGGELVDLSLGTAERTEPVLGKLAGTLVLGVAEQLNDTAFVGGETIELMYAVGTCITDVVRKCSPNRGKRQGPSAQCHTPLIQSIENHPSRPDFSESFEIIPSGSACPRQKMRQSTSQSNNAPQVGFPPVMSKMSASRRENEQSVSRRRCNNRELKVEDIPSNLPNQVPDERSPLGQSTLSAGRAGTGVTGGDLVAAVDADGEACRAMASHPPIHPHPAPNSLSKQDQRILLVKHNRKHTALNFLSHCIEIVVLESIGFLPSSLCLTE